MKSLLFMLGTIIISSLAYALIVCIMVLLMRYVPSSLMDIAAMVVIIGAAIGICVVDIFVILEIRNCDLKINVVE